MSKPLENILLLKMYNIIFCLILLKIPNCFCTSYSNYTLFRGIPVNDSQVRFYESLEELYDVNFWRYPGLKNMPVDFTIRPEEKNSFLRTADKNGLYITTILENVQEAFDKQTVKPYIRRRTDSFDWQSYFRIDDIYNWMQDLSKIYGNRVEVFSIGKTYENRDILAAKVVFNNSKIRSKIIIEGGIHAREWVSHAFVTYLLDQIVHSQHSNNQLLKTIAASHEWYFVPVLNPDGYEYTHTNDRLWRKNRHNGNFGVDINRNFPIGYGTVGVSRTAKSEIFCGESAFSEKESRAMGDFVHTQSDNLEFYLAFHSYGQYIILPYAHTKEHLDNFDEVNAMAKEAARKMSRQYKTKYTHGTAFDTVGYMTSGVSGCWVKKTFQTPYVVTFELRDEGKYGFALPPNQILPTCEETLEGVLSIIEDGTKLPKKLNLMSASCGVKVYINTFVICLLNVENFLMYRVNLYLSNLNM